MAGENSFKTANKLILSGHIKNLSDLLEAVAKTNLAKAMKTGPERFNKLIANPDLFTFGDAYNISEILGVPEEAILKIIHEEHLAKKDQGKKKSRK